MDRARSLENACRGISACEEDGFITAATAESVFGQDPVTHLMHVVPLLDAQPLFGKVTSSSPSPGSGLQEPGDFYGACAQLAIWGPIFLKV